MSKYVEIHTVTVEVDLSWGTESWFFLGATQDIAREQACEWARSCMIEHNEHAAPEDKAYWNLSDTLETILKVGDEVLWMGHEWSERVHCIPESELIYKEDTQ